MSSEKSSRPASEVGAELKADESGRHDDGLPPCDAVGRPCQDDDGQEPSWIDRHSVNCYFCGKLEDERECTPADDLNNDDGGDCCQQCRKDRTPKEDQP